MSQLALEISDDFTSAILEGLSRMPKTIPSRFLYDRRGSEIFEDITRLPEYYLTRTEVALLRLHADELAGLIGTGGTVVEFGAGSLAKTPLLLAAVRPHCYAPIDISAEFLDEAAKTLAAAYPDIDVRPIAQDFTRPPALPHMGGIMTGFFPGSTIGNFRHSAAVDLLRNFRQSLGAHAKLVIGIDTRKDPRVLEAAYDDAAGVTAQFNLNLLRRINRELDGTVPITAFAHHAHWNAISGRMEMHLLAKRDVSFTVSGQQFSMQAGETIHTENSYKYTLDEAWLLARASGWEPIVVWTDPQQLFGLHVWGTAPDEVGP